MAELVSKMQDKVLFTLPSLLLTWKEGTSFEAMSCAAWGCGRGGTSTPLAAPAGVSVSGMPPRPTGSDPSSVLRLTQEFLAA